MIIPPLTYIYLPSPPESCDDPDTQQVIISPVFSVCGFVCHPAFRWLQCEEHKFLKEYKMSELRDGWLEHPQRMKHQSKPSVTHPKEQEILIIQEKIREAEAETDFLCHETKRN
jgi:hypothetical protein